MKIFASLLLLLSFVGCSDDSKSNGIPTIFVQPDIGNTNNSDGGGDAESDAGPDIVECIAETDAEMCARLEYVCGSLDADDNCGDYREISSCGDEATVCGEYATCGGAGVLGACGCAPESDEDLCVRSGIECGELQASDNCGVSRTVASCGDEANVCTIYETCGGAGEPGICGCIPETDTELCDLNGSECGSLSVTDGCGQVRDIASCGDEATVCSPFETCGGDGDPGVCGCVTETDAEMCIRSGYDCGELVGTDTCGVARTIASCGDEATVCSQFETCGGDGVPGACGCAPKTDVQLCQENTYECGSLQVADNCGTTRTIASCGAGCSMPETCGGEGTPGQCGCTSDADAVVCASNSAECGIANLTDNCNISRDFDCGDASVVCTSYDTCGGAGTANECGCTPTTCLGEGILCGSFDDGCGGTLMCDSFCVEELKAGATHVCAVGSGRVKCWGKNDKGQVGNNTTTQQNNPVNVLGLPTVTSVAPGGGHTCVLTTAGSVLCWGGNNEGQLGVGTTVDNKQPGSPAIIAGATQVVSGANHSCALINGGVKCWGSNTYGKIGNSLLNIGTNAAIAYSVDNLQTGVVEIAAGENHNCARKTDGTVWCWGRNQYGQIGNLQLNSDLPVDAYGYNNALTLDANTLVNSPVMVAGITGATQLTAGRDFSCAIDSSDAVWCWGAMTRPSTSTTTCPVNTGYFDNNGLPITKNGAVCSLMPALALTYPVTKYGRVTKATTTDCTADAECLANEFCSTTGKCQYYEYPISTVYVDRAAFSPVLMGHTSAAYEFGAGANHICAVMEQPDLLQSNVQCMGLNTFGQLGDGTNNDWTIPVPVYYDLDDKVVRAQLVTAGDNFSCALIEDANVQCWGSNAFGQIGNTALIRDETYRPFNVKLDNQP
jgi:alpha-tubulin suppressor-like RCC1 family protein